VDAENKNNMTKYSNADGSTTPTITVTDKTPMTKGEAIAAIASTVGFLAGLYYAHNQKSHFWGYVGWGFLGGVVGGGVGRIGQVILEVKK